MYVKACYNDSLARHNRHFISSLSNLGVAYIGYGNIDSAFICQQRALQLSLSTDSFRLHSLYGNIGDLCGRTGRNSIAIICLKRAYDACRLREDSLQCLWNLGEFYYNNGQLDSALYYLNYQPQFRDEELEVKELQAKVTARHQIDSHVYEYLLSLIHI